jgi:putative ABC transport system permease protein
MAAAFGNLVMAIRGIGSNWLRTLLTMLGVLIGVASVIVLLAIGTGSSQSIEKSIESLGSNTLTVFGSRSSSSSGTSIRNSTLNTASVTALSNTLNDPDVKSVSPVVTTSVTATYDGSTYTTSVIGSTASYLAAENYTVDLARRRHWPRAGDRHRNLCSECPVCDRLGPFGQTDSARIF